ncbi:YafY family protein [Xenophilus arseniciresistens]|uniref:YafY family protein n=1 Tax=Xenophilus arseniciresistens TaxID=1283306 RepID=A0AAE3N7X4_9BURK|nr:YafY family protein [Xenophilus arseniciresistens]MDA7416513.1 YafY family protein [Xenophilus arseniciresistens]
MSTRATRLLRLLDQLHRRRHPVTGAWLAETLGVSLRTLYRDVDALRAQGAAIAGDPGVGYVLRPGFVLPPLMFSPEELEALALGARWVASHADPELAGAAQQALDRVAGVLPDTLRLQVETSGLFAPLWQNAAPAPEPWVAMLRNAIREEQVLQLDYRDVDGEVSTRAIWPFAMAFLSDKRLLAAWCELRQDFRHFRADRVLALHDGGRRYPQRRHELLRRWRAHCLAQRATTP